MAYAIVEAGGTQFRVEPGRFYDINLLAADPESSYTLDKVLLVNNEDEITVGRPFIEGATVEGTVMRHRRGKKVIVYKMQPKKKTRKKRGHRQELTRLMINSISVNGSVVAAAEAESSATESTEAESAEAESTAAE
ncbi:MAG: 50S ribosomal protein L21 [Cyanobacteria bacterium P01_A01_bin.83]